MSKSSDSNYIGFESWWNSLLMSAKMSFIVLSIAFAVHITLFLIIVTFYYKDDLSIVVRYLIAILKNSISDKTTMPLYHEGQAYTVSVSYFIEIVRPYYFDSVKKIKFAFFLLGVVYPIAFSGFYFFFRGRTRKETSAEHIRGSQLITDIKLNKMMVKNKEACSLPIGRTKQPKKQEPEHTFLCGRAGSGKTQCIAPMVLSVRERQGKAVLYSYKPDDYFCKFYSKGKDVLFNPLDTRCVGWNLFNEIQTTLDIDAIAASLIPIPPHVKEPYFYNAARDVYKGILTFLYKNNQRHNSHIWDTITLDTAILSNLLSSVKGCEAGAKHIEDPTSKTTANVMSTLIEHTACFSYMKDVDGDFSLHDWMRNGKGFLHITNNPQAETTLKPILTLFIDLLSRDLLSLPDSRERRIHFFVDELGTLHKLASIKNLVTLSRSKGGGVLSWASRTSARLTRYTAKI